jgi:hypothetical protein
MRRLSKCLLALCLIADTTAAHVWGNQILYRDRASVSVGSFQLFLDSQITSCILSQAVIALHFVYVSLRSGRGRGWAYAPLKFILDESGRASFFRSSMPQMMSRVMNESTSAEPESGAACDDLRSESQATISGGLLTGLHQRLLRFQKRRESQCRVFVIPCVSRHDGGTGERDTEFGLSRPAFDMRWLRLLQRLADANTKRYLSILIVCFGFPSLVCSIFLNGEARGIVCLILNSVALVMVLGLLSSKQYNLDKEAVKHVALSFRFAFISVLLVFWIFLATRRAYMVATGANVYGYRTTFLDTFALLVFLFVFLFIVLFDCIPQLPALAQTLVNVRACSNAPARFMLLFIFCQLFWLVCFGYWISDEIRRLAAGKDPDCFMHVGAFELCDAEELISVYSSLFLLLVQALISRVLVPGMSIFVNASVRRLLLARSFIMFVYVTPRTMQVLNDRTTQSLSNPPGDQV